jgi:hypothetical protein
MFSPVPVSAVFQQVLVYLQSQRDLNLHIFHINSLQQMSQVTKSNAVESIRAVIQVLSYRLKELREAHLAKEMALTKFKKMAGK